MVGAHQAQSVEASLCGSGGGLKSSGACCRWQRRGGFASWPWGLTEKKAEFLFISHGSVSAIAAAN